MARFFVDRPVFAWVIALIIALAGLLSIRGLPVQKALNELEFSRKRIATDVRKVLYSAVSNAENNHNLDIDNLVVAEAFVGKNLVMKRFASRARGRSSRILKPFSEITIVVREAGEAA